MNKIINTTKIGGNIRYRRMEMGLSQEALARMLMLEPRLLSQIESGSKDITVKTMDSIAVALETTPEQLLGIPVSKTLNSVKQDIRDSNKAVSLFCGLACVSMKLAIPLPPGMDKKHCRPTCPHCGKWKYLYSYSGDENAFCGYCGQSIDWSFQK